MRNIFAGLAVLAVLLALPVTSLAWDTAMLSLPASPPAKAKITVNLTYTDTSIQPSKTFSINYKPTAGTVELIKNAGLDESDHIVHMNLRETTLGLNLNAAMFGSGLKSGSVTQVTATWNPQTEAEFPFSFSDNSEKYDMVPGDVISSSAEGTYTEVPAKDGSGDFTVNLAMKFMVVGNLHNSGYPARITVQVNASNITTY